MKRVLAAGTLAWAAAAHAQPAVPVAAAPAEAPLAVYAAGSLRAALTDLAKAWERESGQRVALTFGASGLLKERIEAGEAAQVFASANMNHPEALQQAGRAEGVRPFARNALCVLASARFTLAGRTLPQRLLDAEVRLATSTPKADPAGDYAWEMFDRVESSGAAPAGSAAALKAKALQLAGGPTSPQPPAGRSLYAWLMAQDRADAFVTYCTNAAQARQELPALQVLPVPEALNVSALYGVATVKPTAAPAKRFVDFMLGPAGQQLLRGHGFSAP